ncbi:AcrR family transcriptional regulator [Mycobacterium sp. MAA66]|uniref:TetR/AcrR family transcriptional regulator n=1 Tax=Mycobacterium sp. MAA66 TaxID=3156297 RepID=UPI003518EAA1
MGDRDPGLLRAPMQQRSQDSTNRMLDAALDILDRDGLARLTIAAVAKHADVATGTIYHRFKDRHALIVGAQDRFLNRLEEQLLIASAPLLVVSGNEKFLQGLIELVEETFGTHRNAFRAFMMTYADDPLLRARGTESSRRFAEFVTDTLTVRFECSHDTADSAYRLLYADAVLGTLFSPNELSQSPASTRKRLAHIKKALDALLS